MSARNAMAAMLDELMGPKRNVELGKDTKVTFDKKEDLRKLRDEQEIARIDGEIKLCMAEAEKAGEEGLVTKCQELVDKIEQLEKQKTAIEERLNNTATIPPPIDESAIKVMEVCEVCGSMLIKNDAQCRVEEHLSGKMHMGFSKIKVTIEELRERIRKRDEENEKERQKLREERERRSRSRSRDRDRRRSRSRDRHRRDDRDRRDRDRDDRDRRHRR
ncbi:hypothetical protein ANCDUO_09101 [Ancylostoma duodenale]|uniref:LUC7 protein n=1 Tax=Ancylostoma duodenale TaxID=51022 RepID=A0A0C2CUQ6_9BILA|nr:hypothetical protein ANCDUO_09101 [Ancylostoma duodenale]